MLMEGKLPLRFFVITFLWSWLLWLPLALAGLGFYHLPERIINIGITELLMILGAFGPAAGAFYSIRTLEGKNKLKTFIKSFFSLDFGGKAWAGIFLVIGIINLTAWYIPEFFGEERLPALLPNIYVFPFYWLVMVFLGGGQEEIGWRGYILPFLERKHGLWVGNIILGLIWAGWHIPLWFVEGSSQVYIPFIAFVIGCIGSSFFFSWVIKAAGGRPLSGMIAHGTLNALVGLFPTVITELNNIQIRYWLQEMLAFVVGAIFMFALAKNSTKMQEMNIWRARG